MTLKVKLKLVGVGVLVGVLALTLTSKKSSIPENTVMITNLSRTSGGSGSVIQSDKVFSEILTNKHVCDVVQNGGIVTKEDGTVGTVLKYITSNQHDLCLITVSGNLKANAELSSTPPEGYESAVVSGHPHLNPLTMSKGHFSDKRIISVLTGMRLCTDAEKTDPDTELFCLVTGGFPIIRQYEATFVTATIMPGSSGSAVYKQDGKIAAVIFAGAGDFGYGYAVPYEYVYNFLTTERLTLELQVPDYIMSLKDLTKQSTASAKKFCEENDNNKVCGMFMTDLVVEE